MYPRRLWHENDQLFEKELLSGFAWQLLPTAYFRAHGLTVERPDVGVGGAAPSLAFTDSTDLVVNGRKIECKSRQIWFTSPDTIPANRCPLFIDPLDKYERKTPPFAYVAISRPTGAMIATHGKRTNEWKVEDRFDSVREIQVTSLGVPRSCWRTMDTLLQRLTNAT